MAGLVFVIAGPMIELTDARRRLVRDRSATGSVSLADEPMLAELQPAPAAAISSRSDAPTCMDVPHVVHRADHCACYSFSGWSLGFK